jgi:hypothetical protein
MVKEEDLSGDQIDELFEAFTLFDKVYENFFYSKIVLKITNIIGFLKLRKKIP